MANITVTANVNHSGLRRSLYPQQTVTVADVTATRYVDQSVVIPNASRQLLAWGNIPTAGLFYAVIKNEDDANAVKLYAASSGGVPFASIPAGGIALFPLDSTSTIYAQAVTADVAIGQGMFAQADS